LEEKIFEQGIDEYYPQYTKFLGRSIIYCCVHAKLNYSKDLLEKTENLPEEISDQKILKQDEEDIEKIYLD